MKEKREKSEPKSSSDDIELEIESNFYLTWVCPVCKDERYEWAVENDELPKAVFEVYEKDWTCTSCLLDKGEA